MQSPPRSGTDLNRRSTAAEKQKICVTGKRQQFSEVGMFSQMDYAKKNGTAGAVFVGLFR
jgi:hypothetical protein